MVSRSVGGGHGSGPKRRVMVTVDVEAFEMRSKVTPVDRLIWGRFPEGDYGLERIMSIAESRGVPLSMFLDYPEVWAYGDGFLDVGREVLRRGHDLNLHLHLDCVPKDYFSSRGLTSGNLNTLTEDATSALVADVLELHSRVTSRAAVALRGGGYRYNAGLLRALRKHGVPLSSNYNRAAKLQPYDLGARSQFTWENGVIELPVATVRDFFRRSYLTHFNFNIAPFVQVDAATAASNSEQFLDSFYAQHGEDAIAVFVLHSWSFLRMDAAGEFSSVNAAAPEKLAALFASWSKWAEFVTPHDVAAMVERQDLLLEGPITIPARLDASHPDATLGGSAAAVTSAASAAVDEPEATEAPSFMPAATACAICGTAIAEFVDYNGPKRQCPGCGSTERQRVLAEVYPQFIKPEFDLGTKRVLIAAPSASERRLLKAHGVSWRSVDIRPEVKPDILADLCDLSSVPSASFDAVIASFVLTCVHDLDACLSELHRVLRPGGRLFTCDPLRFGAATVEYTDPKQITSWYGTEAFEKYRVGTFRAFGDVDLVRALQARGFAVKTLYGFDAATRSRWVWHMSIKVDAYAPVAMAPRALSGPSSLAPDGEELKRRVNELERELQRTRDAAISLEGQLDKTKETLSFRLGHLLIHAPKSWSGLRRLPAELVSLNREARERRQARRAGRISNREVGAASQRSEELTEKALSVAQADGVAAALAWVESTTEPKTRAAHVLSQMAKSLSTIDPAQAEAFGARAYELAPTALRAKWLAFARFGNGKVRSAAQLLDALPPGAELKPVELERIAEIRGLARLQGQLPTVPRAALRSFEPLPDSVLYVSGSALPFHVAGYTVRTQALVKGITSTGFRVVTALRPGYPGDRGIEHGQETHEVDGVLYHHSSGPHVRRMAPDHFSAEAADALVALSVRTRPQLVHAASNHVNALPALLAARRVGVPFVYEVRGMWELTAATRKSDWERSERFLLERELETLVAREADQVFTLTSGMAEELISRGVKRERISIIPNSVDATQFEPRTPDAGLLEELDLQGSQLTLVYAGSLLHYEGLDDALRAIAALLTRNVNAHLVIAGDGEARTGLELLAAELGITRQVRFLGRISPNQIPRLWSVADVAAFPRKPFRVCELVSPLKPLEPMTMGIPVVVSSVAGMREMVRDGETGLVHAAGDFEHLTERLAELHGDAERRRALGAAGRAYVLRERTWAATGARVVEQYRRLLAEQADAPSPDTSSVPAAVL